MLPVVAGNRATRHQVFLYSLPLAVCAIAPWPLGLATSVYGLAAVSLSGWFLVLAARVALNREQVQDLMKPERRLFRFSILYLFALFGALVVDRMIAA
jgi:protoheme IX farnesyltransferase